jgi:protein phosphatase
MAGEPLPDVRILALCPGDRVLLGSDGLTGAVGAEELSAILRQESTPDGTCRRLIATANANGGDDNVTALVLTVAG